MQLNRRTLARAAVAAAALGTFATALAAGWPDRPVKMVVAFTAGNMVYAFALPDIQTASAKK